MIDRNSAAENIVSVGGAGSECALSVENLGKRYRRGGGFVVRGLSFRCSTGEIVGLTGENGAGKSTTLKCITGVLPFEEGRVTVFGKEIAGDAVEAKRLFGYVPDDHAVIGYLTGREYVRFVADARCVPVSVREDSIDRFAGRLGIADCLDIPVSACSHGTKQKICMLGSLVGNPRLWILDEPVTGLDPRSQEEVTDIMREFAAGGGTVLFSSHDYATVNKVCSRVLEVRGGVIREVSAVGSENENE